jgi:transposase
MEMAMEEARLFTGEVEIDESYFGPRSVRGRRGRGAGGKTPVIGLLKRGGKVFTGMVKNCSRAELEPIIKGQVLSQTTVYIDGWLSYDGLLLSGYKHRRIHHHENEFARGKNHVNGIESF